MDVAGRLDRVRSRLVETGSQNDGAPADAIVLTNLANVRYLTGFTGSAGLLWLTADAAVLITDSRYEIQAAAQMSAAGVTGIGLTIASNQPAQRDELTALAAGRSCVALEAEHVTWAAARRYEEWFEAAQVVALSGVVEGLRAVKDQGEIDRIEAACRIADEALEAVRPMLWDQTTEAGFARALEWAMFERGAEALSFDTIVGSGPNGALPHHGAGSRRIEPGDLVVVDFGAMVDGYHSDMTRTFVVGEPTDEQARMLTAVREAQAAGAAAVGPGVSTRAVDDRCREVLAEHGLADLFHHGTGHGVGLVIHESPMLGKTSTGELEPGNVITVEPGVYVAGLGGVRVEDTLVVTTNGARPLTAFPKDPRCLPSAPTTSRPA